LLESESDSAVVKEDPIDEVSDHENGGNCCEDREAEKGHHEL
jgi:hypothetical protein